MMFPADGMDRALGIMFVFCFLLALAIPFSMRETRTGRPVKRDVEQYVTITFFTL